MNQKKLIAAIDGSTHSNKVLDKAIEFTKLLNAQIVLVYCHKRFPTLLEEPYREQAITSILFETGELLKPYIKKLDESGVSFVNRLMEEPAGTVIPSIAEIEKCEMIIMGSRGLTELKGLIVGSVTHRVLHLAKCPVLVVK